MTQEQGRRSKRDRTHLILGWAMIAIAAPLVAYALHDVWAMDLTALYFAGHFFGSGQPELVYLPGPEVFLFDPPPEWRALAAAEGQPDAPLTPYLYPPLWAALLAPLVDNISAYSFFRGVMWLNLASIAGMIWLSFRFAHPAKLAFSAWTGLSLALLVASGLSVIGVWLGQPQIFVSFITLAAFWLLAERRDLSAGAVLALAAAMKLTPAFLVVIFIMERRWRALASFAVVGAALGLASIALAGWPLHAEFLGKLREVEGEVLVSRIVASLEMWLFQLGALVDGSASWDLEYPWMEPEPSWIGWVVGATLIAGLWLSWRATRQLPERPRLWARLFATLLVTLVTNPLAWIHYLILPLLMLPGFTAFLPARRVISLAAFVALALSMPLFLWMADRPLMGFPQAGLHLGVCLALLALVLILARRRA